MGKQVLIRVSQNDLTYTKKVLEMGPDGIIFPTVRIAAEAKELLSYTLYPPCGTGGCGLQRAVRYGVDDEIATKHGKIAGFATLATEEATLKNIYDMRIKMITCGSDFNYIVNGAKKTYEAVKKVIEK